MGKEHSPVSAELVPVNRGYYSAWDVFYRCSCGRRLKKHGLNTIKHFQPEVKGYARVTREMDTVEKAARDAATKANQVREKKLRVRSAKPRRRKGTSSSKSGSIR